MIWLSFLLFFIFMASQACVDSSAEDERFKRGLHIKMSNAKQDIYHDKSINGIGDVPSHSVGHQESFSPHPPSETILLCKKRSNGTDIDDCGALNETSLLGITSNETTSSSSSESSKSSKVDFDALVRQIEHGFVQARKQPYFYVVIVLSFFAACGFIACIISTFSFLCGGCFRKSLTHVHPKLWEAELDDIERSLHSLNCSVGSSVGSSGDRSKVYIDDVREADGVNNPSVQLEAPAVLTVVEAPIAETSNHSARSARDESELDASTESAVQVREIKRPQARFKTLIYAQRAFAAPAGSKARIAAVNSIVEELSAALAAETNDPPSTSIESNANIAADDQVSNKVADAEETRVQDKSKRGRPKNEDNQAFTDVMKYLLKDLLTYNVDYRSRMKMPSMLPMHEECRQLIETTQRLTSAESLQLARLVKELTEENGQLADKYRYYVEEQEDAKMQAALNQSFLEFLELTEESPMERKAAAPRQPVLQTAVVLSNSEASDGGNNSETYSMSSASKLRENEEKEDSEGDIEAIIKHRMKDLQAKRAERRKNRKGNAAKTQIVDDSATKEAEASDSSGSGLDGGAAGVPIRVVRKRARLKARQNQASSLQSTGAPKKIDAVDVIQEAAVKATDASTKPLSEDELLASRLNSVRALAAIPMSLQALGRRAGGSSTAEATGGRGGGGLEEQSIATNSIQSTIATTVLDDDVTLLSSGVSDEGSVTRRRQAASSLPRSPNRLRDTTRRIVRANQWTSPNEPTEASVK